MGNDRGSHLNASYIHGIGHDGSKKISKYFVAQQRNLGYVNGHIEEVYGGHNIMKAFNAEEQVIEEFDKINGELYDSAWKSQFLSGMMMPIMVFIGNLGYVVVSI